MKNAIKSKEVSIQSFNLPSGEISLEQRIIAAQGEPEGEAWEFDIPRLQAGILDGSIWHFEGSVGRAANDCLESGACFLPSAWKPGATVKPLSEATKSDLPNLKTPIRDAYGSIAPFR